MLPMAGVMQHCLKYQDGYPRKVSSGRCSEDHHHNVLVRKGFQEAKSRERLCEMSEVRLAGAALVRARKPCISKCLGVIEGAMPRAVAVAHARETVCVSEYICDNAQAASQKEAWLRDFLKALEMTTAMKRHKISCTCCGDNAVSNLSLHGRCISRSLHLAVVASCGRCKIL